MKNSFWIPVLLLFILSACSSEPKDQADLSEEELYKKSCITCHGQPTDTSVNLSLSDAHKYTKEQLMDLIKNPPGGMPTIKLTDSDNERLSEWIINQTGK